MFHEMIQWVRHDGKTNDPEFCDMVRQRSLRPTTVGSTARLADEIANHMKNITSSDHR